MVVTSELLAALRDAFPDPKAFDDDSKGPYPGDYSVDGSVLGADDPELAVTEPLFPPEEDLVYYLASWAGDEKLIEMLDDTIPTWDKRHDFPEAYARREKLVEQAGKVISLNDDDEDFEGAWEALDELFRMMGLVD